MIGPFASGANVSLVAKNGTEKNNTLLWMKLSKELQIKKFHKTDPPKSGNSDSKYNFKIFKNQKSNSKRPPKVPKNQKHIRRPQIKKFYKTDPPKNGNSDSKQY